MGQASFQGLTPFRTLDCNTTPLQVQTSGVKRGNIGWGFAANKAASPRYIKFYDSVAAPTLGAGTPVMTIALPTNWSGMIFDKIALYFANGIWVLCTTGVADNDTSAPTANDVVLNLGWK